MTWKRVCLLLLFYAALLVPLVSAQQGLSQSWIETVTLAPPAINTAQTSSNTTGTGVMVLSTGGTIAAGAYRCGVTLFTATNTETPLSTDTATSSVMTTTGTTSSIIIQPPSTNGAGGNVVGWRPYCGLTAGASGAEALITPTAAICSLSTSSTPSCALTSPATLTLQAQFASGSGGPASPGTAVFPQIANQANQALFENSVMTYHAVYWTVSGTAPSACTFNVQTGATIAALANVGQTITCTASGGYAWPSTAVNVFSSVNLATYTAGDTTTKVTFSEVSLPFNPMGDIWFGPVAPTTACGATVSGFFVTSAVPSTIYTCVTTTWTAVTLP